mmetsp:Transcript_82/g.221  ORF Transcript_82/g.221 Transcript_82/m.221 type:complete len:208 (+) Transcript_82:77-700(+)
MGKERSKKDKKGVNKSSKRDKKDRGKKDKKGKKRRKEDDDDSKEDGSGSEDGSYTYEYEYESESGSDSRSPSRGRRKRSRGRGGHRGRSRGGRSRSRRRDRSRRRGRSEDGYRVRGDGGNRLLPGRRNSPRRPLQQLGNHGSGNHKDDLEEFITSNELDSRTVDALEALGEEQQKKVMGTDGGENSFVLKDKVNNPNAVVMSRIRRL